jgi:hypothetical protein
MMLPSLHFSGILDILSHPLPEMWKKHLRSDAFLAVLPYPSFNQWDGTESHVAHHVTIGYPRQNLKEWVPQKS